jgi:hypothetical protein
MGETAAEEVRAAEKAAPAPKMTAAEKATEIERTRTQLEGDLKELEDRIPAPFRSMKAIIGALATTTGGLIVLKKVVSGKKTGGNKAEVVSRVMRDDVDVDRRR